MIFNIFKQDKKARDLLYDNFSYDDFQNPGLQFDLHGWNGDRPIFRKLIDEVKPKLIVEVGSWKGLSAINMAKYVKEKGLDCEIVCIDTWLGSWEHWTEKENYQRLLVKSMRPRLYEQFIVNVIHENVTDIITPLPQSSTNAFKILNKKGIKADLMYIDGSHDQGDVYNDISNYYPLLKSGGIMFGDDYGGAWKGVKHDVEKFSKENNLKYEVNEIFWIFRKK